MKTGENLRRNDSRAQEVAIISASLKEMAKELQIPVVAMAQLNRSPEQRGTRREGGMKYQLSDLKESGAIEQDADVVSMLHREEYYHQNDPAWIENNEEKRGVAELIIAKQRNGPTGVVPLVWDSRCTKFRNYSPSSPPAGMMIEPRPQAPQVPNAAPGGVSQVVPFAPGNRSGPESGFRDGGGPDRDGGIGNLPV